MRFNTSARALFFSLLLSCSVDAIANDMQSGALHVSAAHARATAPGQSSAAVYLTIENTGKRTDKLVRIDTPAAKSAEIHMMSMDGGVMKMRSASGVLLAPAEKISMAPGDGYHIMLTELRSPLVAGKPIVLRLHFKKAGVMQITATVDPLTSAQ